MSEAREWAVELVRLLKSHDLLREAPSLPEPPNKLAALSARQPDKPPTLQTRLYQARARGLSSCRPNYGTRVVISAWPEQLADQLRLFSEPTLRSRLSPAG
jgi:hypothetical protein